jgi:hypothetical protein
MFRSTIFALVVGLAFGCHMHIESAAKRQGTAISSDKLDGVYEFVSESATLTKPRKTTYKITSPEWGGSGNFRTGTILAL